ncbi:hypothetical protein KIPB_001646, partial [Kipferlia bialata]
AHEIQTQSLHTIPDLESGAILSPPCSPLVQKGGEGEREEEEEEETGTDLANDLRLYRGRLQKLKGWLTMGDDLGDMPVMPLSATERGRGRDAEAEGEREADTASKGADLPPAVSMPSLNLSTSIPKGSLAVKVARDEEGEGQADGETEGERERVDQMRQMMERDAMTRSRDRPPRREREREAERETPSRDRHSVQPEPRPEMERERETSSVPPPPVSSAPVSRPPPPEAPVLVLDTAVSGEGAPSPLGSTPSVCARDTRAAPQRRAPPTGGMGMGMSGGVGGGGMGLLLVPDTPVLRHSTSSSTHTAGAPLGSARHRPPRATPSSTGSSAPSARPYAMGRSMSMGAQPGRERERESGRRESAALSRGPSPSSHMPPAYPPHTTMHSGGMHATQGERERERMSATGPVQRRHSYSHSHSQSQPRSMSRASVNDTSPASLSMSSLVSDTVIGGTVYGVVEREGEEAEAVPRTEASSTGNGHLSSDMRDETGIDERYSVVRSPTGVRQRRTREPNLSARAPAPASSLSFSLPPPAPASALGSGPLSARRTPSPPSDPPGPHSRSGVVVSVPVSQDGMVLGERGEGPRGRRAPRPPPSLFM